MPITALLIRLQLSWIRQIGCSVVSWLSGIKNKGTRRVLNVPPLLQRDTSDWSELKRCHAGNALQQSRGDGEQPPLRIHHFQRDRKAEALALDLLFWDRASGWSVGLGHRWKRSWHLGNHPLLQQDGGSCYLAVRALATWSGAIAGLLLILVGSLIPAAVLLPVAELPPRLLNGLTR